MVRWSAMPAILPDWITDNSPARPNSFLVADPRNPAAPSAQYFDRPQTQETSTALPASTFTPSTRTMIRAGPLTEEPRGLIMAVSGRPLNAVPVLQRCNHSSSGSVDTQMFRWNIQQFEAPLRCPDRRD